MINYFMNDSSLTERGQISVPARIRKSMNLRPGQILHWEQISDREMRVVVQEEFSPGPLSVLGYANRFRDRPIRTTAEWMNELREGE